MNKHVIYGVLLSGLLPLFAASAYGQGMDYNTDRVGADFDRITLHLSDPKLCQSLCQQTQQCVAWTYTPAGFNQYETPQCWLKDKQVRAFELKDAVSGTFPARYAQAEADTVIPEVSEDVAVALADCSDPDKWLSPTFDETSICMWSKAVDNLDASFCAAIPNELKRQDCYGSAGFAMMGKCGELTNVADANTCRMAVAVEFPSPRSCKGAPKEFNMPCHMTVANQTGDTSAFLRQLIYIDDTKDRDTWVGALASMMLDYDLLELIEDNRIYDQMMIAVSANRMGAGRYVEPGVCSALAGGYSNADGGLSASSNQRLCLQSMATARVMADWAKGRSMEELLELQQQLEQYGENDYADLSNFPMGLGAEIERAMASMDVSLQAASVTQSGSLETPPADAPPSTGYGTGINTDDSGVATTDTCLFGVCME